MSEIDKCSNSQCESGWVYGKYIDSRIVRTRDGIDRKIDTEYEGVQPCPVCDPVRAEMIKSAESNEKLQETLQSRSLTKRVEHYKREEDSKTRVL